MLLGTGCERLLRIGERLGSESVSAGGHNRPRYVDRAGGVKIATNERLNQDLFARSPLGNYFLLDDLDRNYPVDGPIRRQQERRQYSNPRKNSEFVHGGRDAIRGRKPTEELHGGHT